VKQYHKRQCTAAAQDTVITRKKIFPWQQPKSHVLHRFSMCGSFS